MIIPTEIRALKDENQMLKERIQELQLDIQRVEGSERANQNALLVESLQQKLQEHDKHLRMTLERLTEEHMKCQKLETSLHKKEKHIVSVMEIADRINMHLAKMQKEHPMLKLD